VQREALRIVRYFGYRSALPTVLEMVDTADTRLREAAILALSLIEDPRAMTALIERASSTDATTRAIAARALGQATKTAESVQALLRIIGDDDAWVRYYAAQALGRLGALEALPALSALLNDAAPQVRISAIEALSHLPSSEAFEALKLAANSPEADLRRSAVLGFGTQRRLDAIPILVNALESHDPGTRLVAATALGVLDTEESVAAIGRGANDPDESVRSTAIGLLAQMRSRAATLALIGLAPEYRGLDRVRLALSAASPGRIEGLTSALVDADDEKAALLASALARMRTPEAHAALIAGMDLPNVAARKAVATALGALGGEPAVEALRRAARLDPNEEVRRISALASAQA
jgi:HEAT repeat protein